MRLRDLHPSKCISATLCLPCRLPAKTLYASIFLTMCATCFAYLILANMIFVEVLGAEYKLCCLTICSFLYPLFGSTHSEKRDLKGPQRMFMQITRELEKFGIFVYCCAVLLGSRISSQYLDTGIACREGLCIRSIVFKHDVTRACLLNSHQRANVCPLFRHFNFQQEHN
jgi:hypothetical protein